MSPRTAGARLHSTGFHVHAVYVSAIGWPVSNLKETESDGKHKEERWRARLLFTLQDDCGGLQCRGADETEPFLCTMLNQQQPIFFYPWVNFKDRSSPLMRKQHINTAHLLSQRRRVRLGGAWHRFFKMSDRNQIKPPLCPPWTAGTSHVTWKNHDQHSLITAKKKKCKQHSLSSLYACGQEDNVLRGNKSALTATSKGAVRGLCYLRHRNVVAKHQSKTYQPFKDFSIFWEGGLSRLLEARNSGDTNLRIHKSSKQQIFL